MHVKCIGCGSILPEQEGPVHAYMHSSPACFAAFGRLLASEYSSEELLPVHRLTVDTWALQHPGSDGDRRAIQSVGLHLARLYLQLHAARPPKEINAVMLDFSKAKHTLVHLAPPPSFRMTVADIAGAAGSGAHASNVRAWAGATWQDYAHHHAYICDWVAKNSYWAT